MDLISREAVKEQAKASYHVAESMEQLGNLYEDCINALPSAFEGKTNGEVIKALFPNSEVIFSLNNVPKSDVIKIDNEAFLVERSWWDSPYKGVSE